MRKAGERNAELNAETALAQEERELIIQLCEYEKVIQSAIDKYDPSELANYVYQIARLYNKFYHELPILTAPSEAEKQLRIAISAVTGSVIKKGMHLLGIAVPEKM